MKTYISTVVCLALAGAALSASASTLGLYAFPGQSPVASGVNPNTSLGSFVRGPGAVAAAGSNNFASSGFNAANITDAVTNGDYVGFTLTPQAGYSVSF